MEQGVGSDIDSAIKNDIYTTLLLKSFYDYILKY